MSAPSPGGHIPQWPSESGPHKDSVTFLASSAHAYDTGGLFPPDFLRAVVGSMNRRGAELRDQARMEAWTRLQVVMGAVRARHDARLKRMHVEYRRRSR